MSRTCEICGRGPIMSASRSHSNIQNKKWKYVNLQSKKVGNKTIKICTSCIRTKSKPAHFATRRAKAKK